VNDLELFLYLVPVLLASMTLHELAHALVATRLGDPTPREQGRLTLNPIVHLDPVGTAMFALTYFLSNFIFGWARPVLVQPGHFRRPKEGMALVAVAGPVTNFAIALVFVAALVHFEFGERTTDVLFLSYYVNVVLGLFNLLPIPPLDGSRIVAAVMTDATYARWSALDRYGILILFGVILIFREPFFEVIGSALDHTTELMVRIVGG
jgi:Zn-dependent protease